MHTLFVITSADREDPDLVPHNVSSGSSLFAKTKMIFSEKTANCLEIKNL